VTEVILAEKKYTLEMVGETLREAGTLIIVFTPLYELFEPHPPQWQVIGLELLIGVAALLTGIEVERRRR
jgi:hypothetical protein